MTPEDGMNVSDVAAIEEAPVAPILAALAPLCVDSYGLGLLLGVSERSIQRLDSSGKIPAAINFGACKRWAIDEVRAWLAAGAPPRARWTSMHRVAK